MPSYSHSKIDTFENCKLKYKFRYIDRVEVDLENTVEAFLDPRFMIVWRYSTAMSDMPRS